MRWFGRFLFAAIFFVTAFSPGNSFAQYTADTAAVLSPNGSGSGTMDTGHTEYWWKVTIPSDGKLVITTLSGSTMDIYPYLDEKRSDGFYYQIAAYESSGKPTNATHSDNLMAGTYYVRVLRYIGSGSYTITSAFTAISLENDIADNDSAGAAVNLAYNGSDTGHLRYYANTYTDAYDWWKITIPTDGTLTVSTLSDPTIDVYPYIFEKRSDGTYQQIATAESGGNPTNTTHFNNLMAGTYYVQVYGYTGYGSYTITSAYIPTSLENDVADNDSAGAAVNLAYNGGDTGRLRFYANTYTDMYDWWKITIPSDGKLTVSTLSDSTLDAYPYIFEKRSDGNYHQIASAESGGNRTNTAHFNNLMAGTYYIQMYGYSGYGSYTITSAFTATSLENDVADNDSAGAAVNLAYNGSATGHLRFYANAYTEIYDWWKVTIPSDGKLTVSTLADSTIDIYPYIHEKRSDGNYHQIASNDSGGNIRNATHHNNLMAGTYYIQVYGYSGYGSYTITPEFIPAKYTNDAEPNDTRETALSGPVQTALSGHLGYFSNAFTDVYDWRSFTVPAGWDSLFVRVMTDDTLEADATLHNASGNQIASDGAYGIASTFYLAAPAAGVYAVDIYRYTGYGSYRFIVANHWQADVPAPPETTTTGTLAGTATSTTGTKIAGASITVTPGNIPAVTNSEGQYSVNGLAPGAGYTMIITAVGYESKIVRDLSILTGQTTSANIIMTPVTPGPITTNVSALPNPTAGTSPISIDALVSVNSTAKIAPFEKAGKVDVFLSGSKGGASKTAKVSAYEVANSLISASVNENTGEFYILTAGGKTLLYNDSYTGKANIRVDGQSYQFGSYLGSWVTPLSISGNVVTGTWKITDLPDIQVTMTLSIVRSTTTGEYDTFKASYFLQNTGSASHTVGFFKMLDTNLNGNDYAPVSAGDGYNRHEREFSGTGVPNFWQAYEEEPSQDSSKLTAQGTLFGGGAVRPDRVVIGDWWRLSDVTWDYTLTGDYGDSAVGMWWNPVTISGGGSRLVATLFGLGAVESVYGELALSVSSENQLLIENGVLTPNPFQVNALVTNNSGGPLANVEVRIDLPPGLTLSVGETAAKSIGSLAGGVSAQVQWLVTAAAGTSDQTYSYAVTVTTTTPDIPSNSVPKSILVPGVAVSAAYVAAAEVFVDSDPGKGNAQVMSASDGAFDGTSEAVTALLDVSVLGEGSHMVYVRGKDSNGVWGPATAYLLNKTFTSGELEPPTNFTVAEISNDQGHLLQLSWTPSSDESGGKVTKYRIYRSRSAVMTGAVSRSQFATLEDLNIWEASHTVMVADSIMAGVTEYTDFVPMNGVVYYYWIQAVGADGVSKMAAWTPTVTAVSESPMEFRVAAPYPNPFNPSVTIGYTLPEQLHVRLTIFDAVGRTVAVLENGVRGAGRHEAVWNGRSARGEILGSGIYLYRVEAGAHRAQGKMTLLR